MTYGILTYLDKDVGELVDWTIGVLAFLWLTTLVTVPWNAHFKAKEVLDDAEISARKNILVVESSLKYARNVAKWSLIIAIALHILSAIILYWITFSGISPVGHFAAYAAVMLTFLRPSVRFYEYLQRRLAEIKREFRYPREDVEELVKKVTKITKKVQKLEDLLSDDTQKKTLSWKQEVSKTHKDIFTQLEKINTTFEKYTTKNDEGLVIMKQESKTEFEKVRGEASERLAKITTDSQILDSVRELAKFFKKI